MMDRPVEFAESARLAACRAAQARWADVPLQKRLRLVAVWRRRVAELKDEFCQAIGDDIGKTPAETIPGELLPLAEACRFLERRARRILRPRRVPSSDRPLWLWPQRDIVHRRPRGIVAIVGTWNYPLFLNGVQIVQALVAGNGVVWKPSEVAPRSAAAIERWLRISELPSDLFVVLPSTRDMGVQLTSQADIDYLVFTGHVETGRAIATTLAKRLIPCALELSGCDAQVVLEDADPVFAARAAWFGATGNRGQTCIAVRRAFVPRQLYGAYLDTLRPLAASAPAMSLATPKQAEMAKTLVEDALARGAKLLNAAESVDGARPTVVVDARPDMPLCQNDLFAPVMAVLPYEKVEDVMAAQTQCDYGLGCSIFTKDPARAATLAAKVSVGMVTINDVVAPTAHPATPFGGRRRSGWGVTQGEEGLLEMTLPQVVSVRGGSWRPHYDPPGATNMTNPRRLGGLLDWQHAGTWSARWSGLWRLMGG
jgi:aldehyde dehydrogenase (NAD+)